MYIDNIYLYMLQDNNSVFLQKSSIAADTGHQSPKSCRNNPERTPQGFLRFGKYSPGFGEYDL